MCQPKARDTNNEFTEINNEFTETNNEFTETINNEFTESLLLREAYHCDWLHSQVFLSSKVVFRFSFFHKNDVFNSNAKCSILIVAGLCIYIYGGYSK